MMPVAEYLAPTPAIWLITCKIPTRRQASDKYFADFGERPRVPTPDGIAAKTPPSARRGAPSGPRTAAGGSFPDTHGGSSASDGGDGTGAP